MQEQQSTQGRRWRVLHCRRKRRLRKGWGKGWMVKFFSRSVFFQYSYIIIHYLSLSSSLIMLPIDDMELSLASCHNSGGRYLYFIVEWVFYWIESSQIRFLNQFLNGIFQEKGWIIFWIEYFWKKWYWIILWIEFYI